MEEGPSTKNWRAARLSRHCNVTVGSPLIRDGPKVVLSGFCRVHIATRLWQAVYCPRMSIRFEKIWVQQCKATKGIKRRFGVKSALDYLIREKLLNFADAAEERSEFARELPRFLAEVWRIFNQYELAGYVASLKPQQRKRLRSLLYLRPTPGRATARA